MLRDAKVSSKDTPEDTMPLTSLRRTEKATGLCRYYSARPTRCPQMAPHAQAFI